MKKGWLNVIIVFAVLGMIFSSISLYNHVNIFKRGFAKSSFCSVNEYINCDVVEGSSYSQFFGVPIAGFGICYYVIALVFALYARKKMKEAMGDDAMPSIAFGFWMSCFGILFSLYMAYTAIYILNAMCLTCLGMYIVNIMLFISFYKSMGRRFLGIVSFGIDYLINIFKPEDARLGFKTKLLPHLLGVIVVFVVGGIAFGVLASPKQVITAEQIAQGISAHYVQSIYDVQATGAPGHTWGNPKAKVRMFVFSDFQCPFCMREAFTVKPFLQEYKNDIFLTFLNYPLDAQCNPMIQRSMHPQACLAAKAGICAGELGKFWPYHDRLFRNARMISKEFLIDEAGREGMNKTEFGQCIEDPATEEKLMNDIISGNKLYLDAVPTVIMNGRKIMNWANVDYLRALVDEEIKRSK